MPKLVCQKLGCFRAKKNKNKFFWFSTNRHLNVSLFVILIQGHFYFTGFLNYIKAIRRRFLQKRSVQNARKREIHRDWHIFAYFPQGINSIFHFLDQNGVDMYIQIHPKRIDLIRLPHFSTDTKLYFLKV